MTRMRVPSTLLDRFISWVSPAAGIERFRARAALASFDAGGYVGGRRDRRAFEGWRHGEGSADADILPQLGDLRGRSRDLARNSPFGGGAIATNVTHVVGAGLQLHAMVDSVTLGISEPEARALSRLAEEEWALFSASVDFSGVQHGDALMGMVLRAKYESGDVFGIRRYRGGQGSIYGTRVQVVEADRVSNPNWGADRDQLAGGIQTDGDGRPVAIHVMDRHPGDPRATRAVWRAVPHRYSDGRRIVIHLYDRLRPDQSRGVPYLAPVIEVLKELTDYTDAELRAAVVAALFTVFVKKPDAGDEGPSIGAPTETGGDEFALGKGAILDLAAGEDITIANPGRPNAAAEIFITAMCRQLGVALELPYEMLIKHFSSSYTASRAALEIAYHTWRRVQTDFGRTWCGTLYEWMWEEAIALGRITAPGYFDDPRIRQAYLWAEWIGPRKITLDELKAARADEIDLRTGASNLRRVATERTGGDWEENLRQRLREEEIRPSAPTAPAPAANANADAKADAEDDGEDATTEDAA